VDNCQSLAVQRGTVRYIETVTSPKSLVRNLALGNYLIVDQAGVPKNEAPVKSLQSERGWRIVISAFLDHQKIEAGLRVRFFNPLGSLRHVDNVTLGLDMAEVGDLFGGAAEVFAVTTEEEHAYNVWTEIWLLPATGDAARVLAVRGVIDRFVKARAGVVAGVWIQRETYDGVHSQTKGRVSEFWEWDPNQRALTRRRE
jgi:hypothetical protein